MQDNYKILNDIKPFNDVFFKSCFYHSLFPIIGYFQESISPYISNEIIMYNNKGKIGFGIEYYSSKGIDQLLRETNIKCNTIDTSNNIINDICNSVSNNSPVIIWIDCFYAQIRNDTFSKIHWPHTWLIYGYDLSKKLFNIIEHSRREKLTYDKRTISSSDLVDSYLGYLKYFQKDMSSIPTFLYFEKAKSIRNKEVFSPIKSDLEILINNINENRNKILLGIEYILEFKSFYKDTVNSENALKGNIYQLLEMLNEIINAKEIEKYKAFRYFKNNDELYNIIISIINCWTSLRAVLARYLYSSEYIVEALNDSVKIIDSIYNFEIQYYNQICNKKGRL